MPLNMMMKLYKNDSNHAYTDSTKVFLGIYCSIIVVTVTTVIVVIAVVI